ncbi:MAG: ribosome maturation factor RimM [Pseudomonadota bacterium]
MADELVVVAQIAGAFGVRGEVRVRSFTAAPDDCFAYGPFLDQNGAQILTPLKATPHKDGFIVRPEEDQQREAWEARKGELLHVRKDALPAPDEDEFYFNDLIGCEVVHLDGRALGCVKAVHNFGAQDVLEIESEAGGYMLPFTQEAVPEVDIASRRIMTAVADDYLPDSLSNDAE